MELIVTSLPHVKLNRFGFNSTFRQNIPHEADKYRSQAKLRSEATDIG